MKYFLVVRTILGESVGCVVTADNYDEARELVSKCLVEKSGMYSTFEIQRKDYENYLRYGQTTENKKVLYAFCSSLNFKFASQDK